MRTFLVIPFSAIAVCAAGAQQAVPTRALAKPDVEYAEPFSQLMGVRELRDGRVIAADMRDKSLQAIDLTAKKATKIGREGSGPGEWMLPMRVLPMPGDSTLIFDVGNTRYLVVGPDAKPARVFNTMADGPDGPAQLSRGDAAGRGGAGRGDAARGDAGGAGRGDVARGGGGRISLGGAMAISMSPPRGADARGRTYTLGQSFQLKDDGTIASADSAPILRYDIATKKTDTVAYVGLAKNSASGSATNAGGRQEQTIRIGSTAAYAPADDWAVLPDGRIAIARVGDYHLEIVQPGGRRVVGQPVRFTPVRIGDAEKQEWRDARKNAGGLSMRVDNNNGVMTRSMSNAPSQGSVPEPDSWPAVKPPFNSSAVWAAPNGETWVVRTRAASDKVPTADVFDAQARLVGRVALPERTRLVGFGARGVYLVRIDDDDLQYLQRYGMTWTGCPTELKENCAK